MRKKEFVKGDRIVVKKYADKRREYGIRCCITPNQSITCKRCPAYLGKPVRVKRVVPYGYIIIEKCKGEVFIDFTMALRPYKWKKL